MLYLEINKSTQTRNYTGHIIKGKYQKNTFNSPTLQYYGGYFSLEDTNKQGVAAPNFMMSDHFLQHLIASISHSVDPKDSTYLPTVARIRGEESPMFWRHSLLMKSDTPLGKF